MLKVHCCKGVCSPCPGFIYNRGEFEDLWEPRGSPPPEVTYTKEEDHLKLELEPDLVTVSGRWHTVDLDHDLTNVHTIRIRWSFEGQGFGNVSLGIRDSDDSNLRTIFIDPDGTPFAERDDFGGVSAWNGPHRIQAGVFTGNGILRIFEVELICD